MKYVALILIAICENVTALPLDLVHPLGTAAVSSSYGERLHPIHSSVTHHDGIDLPCPAGTPIRSLADGVIVRAANEPGYGNTIVILHANNFSSVYAHLKSWNLEIGTRVKAGQIIGKAGSSGLATGPHLHFELRKAGRPLNPIKYVPFLIAEARG